MKTVNVPSRVCLALFPLLCVFSLSSLHAAAWGGGDGDWVSDNWGLDSPDGSPGDPNYLTTSGDTGVAGTILIKAGDSINLGVDSYWVKPGSGVNQINQTGGYLTNSGRIFLGTSLIVSGGTFAPTGTFNFSGSGGTFEINGGSVTPFSVQAKSAGVTNSTLRVIGSNITTLESSSVLILNSTDVSTTSLMDFVFDASGVKSWDVTGGGNSLNLGTIGDNSAADLSVNVSALEGDGVTGVKLFDYDSLAGAFGTVSITDTTFGSLTPGTQGSLAAGQYFLDYGAGSNSTIELYYNTIPEPGSLTLAVAGLMTLGLLRRRRCT